MHSVNRLWDPFFGLVMGKFYPVQGRGTGRVGVPAAHCLVPLRVSPSNPSEMSLIKCGQDQHPYMATASSTAHGWPSTAQIWDFRLRPSDSRHFASHTPSPGCQKPLPQALTPARALDVVYDSTPRYTPFCCLDNSAVRSLPGSLFLQEALSGLPWRGSISLSPFCFSSAYSKLCMGLNYLLPEPN